MNFLLRPAPFLSAKINDIFNIEVFQVNRMFKFF